MNLLSKLGFKRCRLCNSLYRSGDGNYCSPPCTVMHATQIMDAERDAAEQHAQVRGRRRSPNCPRTAPSL
jgi:hypothetical protein